eukprot:2878509-Pyramimonas_sp.AAC.1
MSYVVCSSSVPACALHSSGNYLVHSLCEILGPFQQQLADSSPFGVTVIPFFVSSFSRLFPSCEARSCE